MGSRAIIMQQHPQWWAIVIMSQGPRVDIIEHEPALSLLNSIFINYWSDSGLFGKLVRAIDFTI